MQSLEKSNAERALVVFGCLFSKTCREVLFPPKLCPRLAEFWGVIAKDFFWKSKPTGPFLSYNFDVTKGEIFIKCMEGASTNICYNLLDRNVHERKLGDRIAFFWLV